ncbi:putative disease resistance protein [Dorcoceras hygrometricum]|uniref:Putative disease resistance protein n=1 Tax=Dorcoceras hygrometricum TaxID=472368 RepID=A0A2Z7A7T3_9LAMI|nr:putative disease resistance protein [Dorcoceras hygrometricum]
MGCPGQARTKPRSKIQPSQQFARDRRRTAAAATIVARGNRPNAFCRSTRTVALPISQQRLQRLASIAQQIARRPAASGLATALATAGLHRATDCAASSSQRPISMREAAPSIRPPCATSAWLRPVSRGNWHFTVGGGRLRLIKSTTGIKVPSSAFTRRPDEIITDGNSSKWDRNKSDQRAGGGAWAAAGGVRLWSSGIQLAVGPQPLRLRNHNFGLAQWIMVKRLATSRHDPLGITDSACKNQLVVVSVQYGPFNPYIPIRSTTIGKSRVAKDPIAMHTSWRSNSDIASVTRVSMTFRVVRTNQYNQDLGLFHSTNGNHLQSPNEGSSIDHQAQKSQNFKIDQNRSDIEYRPENFMDCPGQARTKPRRKNQPSQRCWRRRRTAAARRRSPPTNHAAAASPRQARSTAACQELLTAARLLPIKRATGALSSGQPPCEVAAHIAQLVGRNLCARQRHQSAGHCAKFCAASGQYSGQHVDLKNEIHAIMAIMY